MDHITISELEVSYQVGVPDEERAQPQRLLLTVQLFLDLAPSAASDDLTRTVNYFEVSQRLLQLGRGRSWKLIETLASDIANLILTEFKVDRARVEVKKFIIPEARHVSVTLERSTGQHPRGKQTP